MGSQNGRHTKVPPTRHAPALWPAPSATGGRVAAAVRPRRRRRPVSRRAVQAFAAAGALALLVAVGFTTNAYWRLATRIIVVDDALEPSDLIYVLNGSYGMRAALAARLYEDGLAPRVVLPHTLEIAPASGDLPQSSLSERVASVIRGLGVPESAVSIIPFGGGVVNTRDEAHALRLFVEESQVRRVIVVTTDYHTGRARRTIRRALRGLDVEILMAAAPDDTGLTPFNWWESEQGRRVYGEELLKQAAVMVGVTG